MVKTVEIAGRTIGPGLPCFVIAEAGVNHNGDIRRARLMVEAAIEAGVDAIKFQTFKAEQLAAATAPKANYQLQTTGSAESQLEMLKRLELSYETEMDLFQYCKQRGILVLSSPFDEESVDFLGRLGIAAFKIPSGEITNLPFLERASGYGIPMILSTGMSNLKEVETAVRTIRHAGDPPLILLHCVSDYPARAADINLRAMHTMERTFHVPVGYSDHTMGIEVAIAAVALGACMIEKHFTLDRNLPGPDHRASLEPEELKALVKGVRAVESALGNGCKEPAPCELHTAAIARKSLVAAKGISAGTVITLDHVTAKRPGTGLPPVVRSQLIGRQAKRDIAADTILSWEMVE